MNLRSRLAALERQARVGGLLSSEPRCPTCGGPGASPISMILLDEGDELRHCLVCTRPISEDGRPYGKIVVVLHLHDAPPGHSH
jgi:hypothetical protein